MATARLTALVALGLVACVGCTAREYPGGDTRTGKARGGAGDVGYVLTRGTRIGATIQDALSSRGDKTGDTLVAFVSVNIKDADGAVVIPAGSIVRLTVAPPGLDDGSPPRLSLVVNSVTVNARAYPVTATLDSLSQHLSQRVGPNTPTTMIVSAGTPIVFTLAQSLNVSAR